MACRFPPPVPLHNSPESDVNNSRTVAQLPIVPLQVFTVPPPPIPPPLPLFLPPSTLQQYHNIPSEVYSVPGAAPLVHTSDVNVSMVPFIGVVGSQTTASSELQYSDESQLQQKDDELWIKDWLSRRKHPTSYSGNASIAFQVFQAKDCLKDLITSLHHLKTVQLQLVTNVSSMDSDSWESAFEAVQHKSSEFQAALSKLENLRIVEELKRALDKRTKKRDSQKRRRLLHQELHTQAFGRRQQLHRSIDGWLKDMQGAVEKAKIDESLKEEADTILSDVTRKKTEARRQLALLSALLKLHQLRVKTAANKGERISAEHGIRFSKVTDHLRKLWEKQLKEYNLEEQGLRVMLNEAVDERDQTRVLREKRNLKQWEQLLFGERQGNSADFYTAAENSLEAFINIRRDWDKFITSSVAPMSSAIPVGWVLPTIPSSAEWETVLSYTQSVD